MAAELCASTDLLEVDDWLPEFVLCLVEISHSDFTKVSGMVLVDVRSVMMLATSHTTTTGMLAVLAYTTVTCRDMAATEEEKCQRMLESAQSFRADCGC